MSFDFGINNESDEEIAMALEASVIEQDTLCVNNAPLLCFQKNSGAWCLIQGCCNSWQCPRCSTLRARHEYGNIVHGAKTLAEKHPLGPKEYWRSELVGKATNGLDNHLLTNEEFEEDWREFEEGCFCDDTEDFDD